MDMSLVSGMMAARTAEMQMALAAKFAKMNAANTQSMVQLIEASAANLQKLSAAATGLGQNVDIQV